MQRAAKLFRKFELFFSLINKTTENTIIRQVLLNSTLSLRTLRLRASALRLHI